jgi:hypothetical protein
MRTAIMIFSAFVAFASGIYVTFPVAHGIWTEIIAAQPLHGSAQIDDPIHILGRVVAVDTAAHDLLLERNDPFAPGTRLMLRIHYGDVEFAKRTSNDPLNTDAFSHTPITSGLVGSPVRAIVRNESGPLEAVFIIVPTTAL